MVLLNLIKVTGMGNKLIHLQKENDKYFLLAWIVISIGFLLRFHNLDAVGLWSDELFTVSAALDVGHGLSWFDFTPKVIPELTFNDSFITWKAADNTPPLFEFVLILWAKCFGTSDFSLRSLPAFLGSLSPLIFFYGLRKKIGYFPAFLGSALFALSPSAIIYAQEVRSYTLALFLCTIATVRVTNHVLQQTPLSPVHEKWTSNIWLDIGVLVLLAYSHYTGLFMAGLLAGIYVFLVTIPQRKYSDVLKFLIVPLAVFPWMLLSKKAFVFSSHGGYAWRTYYPSEITSQMLPDTLNFFLLGNGTVFSMIWLVALFSSLTAYAQNRNWVFTLSDIRLRIFDRKIILAIFLVAAVGLLFMYSVYNAFTSKMWHSRYFVVSLPVVFCSFALLFSASRLNRLFSVICATLILILSLMGNFNYFYKDVSYKEEYREASAYITDNIKDDSVILLNWKANEAYYRHYLDKILPKTGVAYSFKSVSTSEDVKQVCDSNQRKGRHFFIFQHQDQAPLFEDLGRCSGIKKISGKRFRGVLVDEFAF